MMPDDVVILRHKLGTASGYDEDREYIAWYDFQPAEGVNLPACPILYYWESTDTFLVGKIYSEDDDPMEMEEFEAVKLLASLPRV
jgi:hypothetical protein